MLLSIAKSAWSAPPMMPYVSVVPASGSVPVTVCTAVWFSATLTAADDMIVGDSLTFVTEIVNAFSVQSPPWSVERTRTVQLLFVS